MLSVILLVNLLIALMSKTFDLVFEIAKCFAQPTKFEQPEHALASLQVGTRK